MTTSTAVCNSAKQELFEGAHDFRLSGGDAFTIALIEVGAAGTYGAASTSYSDIGADESAVSGGGGGYTAGGIALTRIDPTLDSGTAIVDFADETITLTGGTDPSLGAEGMMIYNDTDAGDAAISTHAFAGDPTATGTGATFDIEFPAAAAATAILRIA